MNRTVKGDLLALFQAGHFDVIVHGCNCHGTMGAGLAKQIALAYPEVQLADRRLLVMTHDRMGNGVKPGGFLPVSTKDGWVVNLYTQDQPGPNAELTLIRSAFQKMAMWLNDVCPRDKGLSEIVIGVPQVGCGIGGLRWPQVRAEIQAILGSFSVVFVDYEPQKIVRPPEIGPLNVPKMIRVTRELFESHNGDLPDGLTASDLIGGES